MTPPYIVFLFALCLADSRCSDDAPTALAAFEYKTTFLAARFDQVNDVTDPSKTVLHMMSDWYAMYTGNEALVNSTMVTLLNALNPCTGNERFDFVAEKCVCNVQMVCDLGGPSRIDTEWNVLGAVFIVFCALIVFVVARFAYRSR